LLSANIGGKRGERPLTQSLEAPAPEGLLRRLGHRALIRNLHRNAFAVLAALFATAAALACCSPMSFEIPTEPAPPANYGQLVATALKPYPDFAAYGNFELSSPRWVHAETGWNWLSCLRFEDHGHRRIYSFFINNSTVVNARYDIITDHCGAQQYAPFDRITGAVGLLPIQPQQPGYFGPPALQPQQPIY